MGSSYISNPLVFLIDVIFGLYILMVMLRVLLQWAKADFYNPLSQLLVKATNPPLLPLQRIIPSSGSIDLAAVVLLIILQMISLTLIGTIRGASIGIFPLFILTLAELLSLLINVFLFSILIQVVLSWLNPGTQNPAIGLIYSLTEPVLKPLQRMIPPMQGLDLSPLVAMLVLQLAKMILIPPLLAIA